MKNSLTNINHATNIKSLDEKAMKKRSTHLSPAREETLRLVNLFTGQVSAAVLKGFKEGNVEGSFGAGEVNDGLSDRSVSSHV